MRTSNHLIARLATNNIVHLIKRTEVASKNTLDHHICESLNLIKAGKYEDAISNFEDQAIAKKAGFNLVCHKIRPLRSLSNKSDVCRFLDMEADCSYFNKGKKEIVLNKLISLDELLVDVNLKDFIRLEESLLFAEEWIHALQHTQNGNPISSHGKKIYSLAQSKAKINPVEIEVADYFLDHGIPWELLKKTHWIKRYDRKKVLPAFIER